MIVPNGTVAKFRMFVKAATIDGSPDITKSIEVNLAKGARAAGP
jgi:hypothetical protein